MKQPNTKLNALLRVRAAAALMKQYPAAHVMPPALTDGPRIRTRPGACLYCQGENGTGDSVVVEKDVTMGAIDAMHDRQSAAPRAACARPEEAVGRGGRNIADGQLTPRIPACLLSTTNFKTKKVC